MSLKNQEATITTLQFFQAESIQLGLCPLVLAVKRTCGLCKTKMYSGLMENSVTGQIRKMFICYRCGSVKDMIDDLDYKMVFKTE